MKTKKIVSVILTVCLLAGIFAAATPVFAAKAAAGRKTTVIVEFEGKGELQAADVSAARETRRNAVQAVQEAADVSVLYTYSQLFSGVAVEARQGDLDALRQADGVAAVYEIGGVRPVLEVAAAGEITSGAMIGLEDARKQGLDGTGTAIAVIDGGFDINHETMRLSDESKAKYTKADVSAVIASHTMNSENIKVNDVYKSAKIPFAFDYCDGDTIMDDDNNSVPYHGTHVSGIAAGNSGRLTGIAPEAQVLMFKIDLYDDDVFLANMLAAIDDAAKFDVASINLSVGIDYAIPDDPAYELLSKAFNNARASGILVCCAAGNAERFSNYVSLPDNGANGIPNDFEGATSVASVDNIYLSDRIGQYPDKLIYDGGKSAEVYAWGLIIPFPEGDLDYVPLTSNRVPDSAAGKCVLLYKNQNKYTTVLKNIIKSDASSVVMAEEVYDTVSWSNDYDLLNSLAQEKAVLIVDTMDVYSMSHAKQKTARLQYNDGYYVAPAENLQVSEFSSWGIGEDGSMTVDIAAPGGVIYSSVMRDQYDVLDGTSMASPHIAGVGALIEQYLEKKAFDLTRKEKADLKESLLMSTADPIPQDETHTPVRAVGAGLVNLSRALSANAILLGDNDTYSALNLGDKLGQTFKMTFTVKNFSDESVRYDTLNLDLASDAYAVDRTFNGETGVYENVYYTTGKSAPLQFTMQSDMPRSITLAPGESHQVTVTVTIDDADFAEYTDVFTNGFFADGYITLSDSFGKNTTLNMPFLGFVGDWDAVPALFEYTDPWFGDTSLIVVRSLQELRYVLTDANGNKVGEASQSYVSKGTYLDDWDLASRFEDVPDGTYTLTIEAVPVGAGGKAQSYPYGEILIDTHAPEIVRFKTKRNADGSGTITVTMRTDDTAYFKIEGASLLNGSFTDYYPVDTWDSVDGNGNYVYVLSEDKLPIGGFVVTAVDAAGLSDSKGFSSPLLQFTQFLKELPQLLYSLFLLMIFGVWVDLM